MPERRKPREWGCQGLLQLSHLWLRCARSGRRAALGASAGAPQILNLVTRFKVGNGLTLTTQTRGEYRNALRVAE